MIVRRWHRYLQSRVHDAIKAKKPIPGRPMNRKARNARRPFVADR